SISVRDTGVGIEADDYERIFEPFFTTKTDQARGLGLTVVKRLLELVGGGSRVQSELGKGTTITLMIPGPGASALKPMTVEQVQDIAAVHADTDLESPSLQLPEVQVEIRKPKVRMFD